MKKLIALVLFSLATISLLNAQTKDKQHEIGIALSNFQSIGVTYRIGQSKALWRFTTLFGDVFSSERVRDSTNQKTNFNGFSLAAGREWRNAPNEKIELRWGFDLEYSYSNNSQSTNLTGSPADFESQDITHSYGANAVLGANYLFNDNLFIGVELLPYVSFSNRKSTTQIVSSNVDLEEKTSSMSFGLNSSSAQLVLGFRF